MKRHITTLDGLRGAAIITVVVSHFSNHTGALGGFLGSGAGQLGVMLFFALSGFLMAHLYIDQPCEARSIKKFFCRRVARVLPLYYVALSIATVYLFSTGKPFPGYRVEWQNVLEHWLLWRGDSVLWTIAVEVQFYMLFPLLWAAYARFGMKAVYVSLLGTYLLSFTNAEDLLPVFGFGHVFMVGVFANKIRRIPNSLRLQSVAYTLLGLYLLSYPEIISELPGIEIPGRDVWTLPFYIVLTGLLVLVSANAIERNKLLDSSPMRWMGKVSYSAYIVHKPLLAFIGAMSLGVGTYFIIFAIVTALVSEFSYRIIERPMRTWITSGNPSARFARVRLPDQQ